MTKCLDSEAENQARLSNRIETFLYWNFLKREHLNRLYP